MEKICASTDAAFVPLLSHGHVNYKTMHINAVKFFGGDVAIPIGRNGRLGYLSQQRGTQ